jgi:hypothetical protein
MTRRLSLAAATAAVFLAGTGAALSGTVPAASASVSRAVSAGDAAPADQEAFTSTGTIRPADNPHWCLTSNRDDPNTQLAYLEACIKGWADQQWFSWYTVDPYSGGINTVLQPDLVLAKASKKSFAYLVNGNKPGPYISLVNFAPYMKGMLVAVKVSAKKLLYLSVPVHMKTGKRYKAVWLKSVSQSELASQEWLFASWKKLDS